MNYRKFFYVAIIIAACLTFSVVWAAVTGNLLPLSDGNYAQWTPKSGTTHYTMVDEATCNGTTDYNYTATVGNRDSYGVSLSSIPNYSTITNINLTPCASRNSSGTGSSNLDLFYRFDGNNSADAGNYALPTGTTPANRTATNFSSLALTKTSGSILEVGAVYTSGNKGVRLGRLATVITYSLPTPPAAPTDLSGYIASGTLVYISWTDNSTTEENFKVYRSLNNNYTWAQIATTSADVTSYYDYTASADQTYYYRVSAANAGGNSGYSNVVYVITATQAPAAPTNLSANYASSTVMVSWSDNSSNEAEFKIERSLNNDYEFTQIATTSAGVNSYYDSGTSENQTYYYRVRASNVIGNSGYSNVRSVITATQVPSAPTGLEASFASSTVSLAWTDNSANEEYFKIERSLYSTYNYTQIATVTAGTVVYYDSSVSDDQTYYYRVRASNSIGNSGYSNVVYVITATEAPTAPTNLSTFSGSSSSAFLYWSQNSSNEEGFKIERSDDGVDFTEVGTTPMNVPYYDDYNLDPGVYYYRVRAYNLIDDSSYSNIASSTVM